MGVKRRSNARLDQDAGEYSLLFLQFFCKTAVLGVLVHTIPSWDDYRLGQELLYGSSYALLPADRYCSTPYFLNLRKA